MAVIQVSKIQIRRGAIGDQALPQLASGELAWAIDTQQLFIGNGSVAEGAPAVGNTEILTERSLFDVLGNLTSSTYVYKGLNNSVIIQTGPDSNHPIERTLQQRLDESVTALSFGVNTTSSCSVALQRAVDQIFQTEGIDKPLRIPAGTYYVTGTVYLPPNATLIGDGIDKTIIYSQGTGADATIFSTKGWDGTSSTYETPYNPKNIKLAGMTLAYDEDVEITDAAPLLKLVAIEEFDLESVKFAGNYSKGDDVAEEYTAISFDDIAIIDPIYTAKIDSCYFDGLCYPIRSNIDITDVYVSNNMFNNLHQGLTFSDDLTGLGQSTLGPQRVDIRNNKFYRIEKEGIFVGANESINNQINSENNLFIDVGDNIGQDAYTPIITFQSLGNSSINDVFDRLITAQTDTTATQKAIIDGTAEVRLKFTSKAVMEVNTSSQTIVRVPYDNNVTSMDIYYTVEKTAVSRKGSLSVVGGVNGVSIKDSYALAGNGDLDDLVFTAELEESGNPGGTNYDSLTVKYDNPTSTGTCIFNVSYYR